MTCAIENPYTNLVLAVPHAEDKPSDVDWSKDAGIAAERDRWTDWLTDELFFSNEEGVIMVRGAVSRLDCDLERLEGEDDRLCKFRRYATTVTAETASLTNRMLAEWFRYRAEVMEAASLGERPLIIDCHSFPADLAPDVDVCVGFNDDGSCPPKDVMDMLASCFRTAGFKLAFNRPYANALAPVGYCGHSLMIEVNKRCYLKEGNKMGARYVRFRDCLRRLFKVLLGREVRDDATDRHPAFTGRNLALHASIWSCAAKIKATKGCKTRFEKALWGARQLMCYLHWLGEDDARRTDLDSLAYGRSLAAWLSPLEIVYVMQYELDARNLCLLRRWLSHSVQHQCRPETLTRVATLMEQFNELGDMTVEEAQRRGPSHPMARCARVHSREFFSGKGWSAASFVHPWHGPYCQWFNRYTPLLGIQRFNG